MTNLLDRLREDIRYQEGMKACINCGTCTAVCPAAAVSNYDPREIVDLVQSANEDIIIELLSGDQIWYCGECLSCKTRCPRGNTPCYIIQALRSLSIESGLFSKSSEGVKQKELVKTIGSHILEHGYCIYIDNINIQDFPEQGPVWEWFKNNRESLLSKLGCSYNQELPGALRKISPDSMKELNAIFKETGALERFKHILEQ